MYVRDLEPGALLRPNNDREWDIGKISDSRTFETRSIRALNELIESGIHHHATARFDRNKRDMNQSIAVYLGVKILKNYYYGVKRQHMLLIGDTLAVMDGYQFRDIKKV